MPPDTKVLISETFREMVRQKGIDKVTVKSLIDACQISRQTFYYHFQDIMEVIQWSMEQTAQNNLSRSLNANSPEEAIGIFLSAAAEDYPLIIKLLDSRRREQIEKIFVQAVRKYLGILLRKKGTALVYSDIEVTLDFWAFGLSGLLFRYCGQKDLDIPQLSRQIYRLLSSSLPAAGSPE